MNPQQVWQAALGELHSAMTPASFETWIKHTLAVEQRGGRFTIAAPNTFAKEWLDTRLRPQIEKTLGRVLGRPASLQVIVEGFTAAEESPRPPARRRGAGAHTLQTQLNGPFQHAREVEDARVEALRADARPADDAPAPTRPVGGRRRRAAVPPAEPPLRRYDDDRWTFESFIIGSSNRFAYAAAEAVAAEPATVYNPLFIHGGVGLGKTHLLHAIAQATADQGLRVLYVTCEQFTNDLIDAIQRRQTDEFRAAYRSNDVLLVDDIQFLAGKESTQEEFFHTFNHLHGARRQVVISSDRPPRAIATLEERLTSRFESGLIVDVQPPDLETRTAILRARAATLRPTVPAEVIDMLAQRVQRNVRELEGSLTTVAAYARLNGLMLTVDTATRALAEVTTRRARAIQPSEVVAAVARHFHVDPKLLRGKQRDREIVLPRHVAMYLMREETTASLLEIGRELGGRDHSTVLHGWEKIRGEVESDDGLRRAVLLVRERLLAEGY